MNSPQSRYSFRLLLAFATIILLVATRLITPFSPATTIQAADPPELLYTESFTSTTHQDFSATTANWSTEEEALLLSWRNSRFNPFTADTASMSLSSDTFNTYAVDVGDMDGDGDLDIVLGDYGHNKLHLNDGNGNFASGTHIGSETDFTYSIAVGDVDNDGDLDVVAGNYSGVTNKLYLNDGSGEFPNVGTEIGSDTDDTMSVAMADMNGDRYLDIITGNNGSTNKLYLNDRGEFTIGTNIGGDTNQTYSIAVGDINSDGHIDEPVSKMV